MTNISANKTFTNTSKASNKLLNTNSGELVHKEMFPGNGEDGEVVIKEKEIEFDSFSPNDSKNSISEANVIVGGSSKNINKIDYQDKELTRTQINQKVKDSIKNLGVKTNLTS